MRIYNNLAGCGTPGNNPDEPVSEEAKEVVVKKMIVGSLVVFLGTLVVAESHGATTGSLSLSVLVDGVEQPEYTGRGMTYIEAFRGRPYELRITNPYPFRVAVALSVDGLNTIDARHSDAWSAQKWALDPYQTLVVPGWQVSGSTARQFFFTGERGSYGALLGKTENLGVIEAACFRERPAPIPDPTRRTPTSEPMDSPGALDRGAGVPAPKALEKQDRRDSASDDYAATGMGGRRNHEVFEVHLDLDRRPIGSVRIRYEFRRELIALGILRRSESGLERRERARGFRSYCPEPER